ncbi:MAG TPA: DUF2231 domain-containing protein [Marmoricola sp.]|nr:DUF2231 domain-containing protein [Marmoricola sp.]
MEPTADAPTIVRSTLQLEQATALDPLARAVEPLVRPWAAGAQLGPLLRGDWLGHAVHPVLTDVAVGAWVSAGVLDLVGGADAAPAAQRLIGIGVLTAAPTAWTGWAEWLTLTPRDRRVGVVHALVNATAIAAYAGSWSARRRGRRAKGVALGLTGAAIAGVGAYLGGHLTEGRRVASHHPAYDET